MSNGTTPSSGSAFGKFLGFVCIVGLIGLIVFLDMRRRDAEQKLSQLSMKYEQQNGNQAQNQEAAKQIVNKVRKLFVIPADVDPTVATIVDVNELRTRNAFYNKAKNGDNLIVTQDRAILYDPVADKIIDVVPVQIQATATAGQVSSQTRELGTKESVSSSVSSKSASSASSKK